jgi:hypothetical protein
MRRSQNILVIAIFVLIYCFFSCDKSESKEIIDYFNMPVDENLIGDWHKSYSVVGDQNSISVWTDSIQFNSNNSGSRRIHKLGPVPDSYFTFEFYTEDNTIFLKYDVGNEKWTYVIRNDSLFIRGRIPYVR